MKLSLLFIFYILFFTEISFSQVGINTSQPQGIFHIDAKKNTSGTTNTSDDVLVTSKGYLGVGTIAPDAALHLKTTGTQKDPVSAFKLQDGSEASGKYLVSNADGVGSWSSIVNGNSVRGVLGAGVTFNLYTAGVNSSFFDTKSYIDLPVGRWMVYVVMRMPIVKSTDTSSYWLRTSFADSNSNLVPSSYIVGSNLISGLSWYDNKGIVYGFIIINNSTAATKRFYYIAGRTDNVSESNTRSGYTMLYGGSADTENNIVAFQLKL